MSGEQWPWGEGEKLRVAIKQCNKTAHIAFRYQDNKKNSWFSKTVLPAKEENKINFFGFSRKKSRKLFTEDLFLKFFTNKFSTTEKIGTNSWNFSENLRKTEENLMLMFAKICTKIKIFERVLRKFNLEFLRKLKKAHLFQSYIQPLIV